MSLVKPSVFYVLMPFWLLFIEYHSFCEHWLLWCLCIYSHSYFIYFSGTVHPFFNRFHYLCAMQSIAIYNARLHFSFCFAQSLFWLKLTDCLAQRYVFLFCYAAHIFISQLSVVTCFRIYCILAVIVNFPVDYFFCHFCLRLTCTFGSHLQVAVTPVGRGFPYHTYIRYTVNDFSGYIEDICSYAHLTEGILNCLEKKDASVWMDMGITNSIP